MKKKQLIITAAVALCVLVGVFAALALNGSSASEKETASAETSSGMSSTSGEAYSSESLPSEYSGTTEKLSSGQTDSSAPSETSSAAESQTQRETAESSAAETQSTARQTQKETASAKKTTSAETKTTQNNSISVTISISCKNALDKGADVPRSGYFLNQTQITLQEGKTVFDALESACEKNGISLNYQSKAYIIGIGGLNEKDCGSSSGWMYRVNGKNPMKAASKYTLSNGDKIEWYYVTNSSDR